MNEELLEAASSVATLYAAMFTATLAGQLGGIALCAALGTHTVLLPLAASVLLEAFAGARAGASRLGSLTPARCVRIAGTYSLLLAGISLPLAGWVLVAAPPGRFAAVDAAALVWILGGLVVATALRAALMFALAPRGR